MNSRWSEEQVAKVKAAPQLRERIRKELEASLCVGELDPCYPGAVSPAYLIGHRVATEDGIRQFCRSIGEVNPLYISRDYAQKTVYGGLIAPPSFLHAITLLEEVGHKGPFPDYITTTIYASSEIEWFKEIREGDEFSVLIGATDIQDITREDTEVQFMVRGRRIFKNQRGEVVAIHTGTGIRVIQPVTGGKKKPIERLAKVSEQAPLHYFSEPELEEWYRLTEQEEIRGASPLYWEDVNVGDELPPTHHFATVWQMLTFRGACGALADWRFTMERIKAKKSASIDPSFLTVRRMLPELQTGLGGLDRPAMGGILMNCWLSRLVTNWMGDAAFLKKLAEQYRKPLIMDALVTCKGGVVKKYVDGERHLVDLHITLEDHNGLLIVPNGSTTVVLPSRHAF